MYAMFGDVTFWGGAVSEREGIHQDLCVVAKRIAAFSFLVVWAYDPEAIYRITPKSLVFRHLPI